MTTLISAYNSSGCIGRCDAKCHDAEHPDCVCICGGKNHGVGAQKAMENAQAEWQDWIDQYNQDNGGGLSFEVSESVFQLALF